MATEIIPPDCRNCGEPATQQVYTGRPYGAWECDPCAHETNLERNRS